MITEKEIMVGNLFIRYDDKIFAWSLEHFQLLWNDVNVDEIIKSPITITDDWLVNKFEFGRIDSYFDKGGLRLLPIRDLYYRAPFPIKADIKYIHQLQNLYFALTQTELELKS